MASPATQPSLSARPYSLSGCDPVPMSDDEIGCYEGRYEHWDADSELAWMVRDVSPRHEEPSSRLVALVNNIGMIRGRPVTMYGNADLQERDARGGRLRAVQADQLVYLARPETLSCEGRAPRAPPPPQVIVVGAFPLPDVVFEVDLTTDVRERKLGLYESWGVPELWVEVPDADMPSKRKRPGLTIHVLSDGRYRASRESVAFPTWSAREIHRALNEPWTSTMTVATLRRVGEAMGRLVGAGPEDDPFLGAERLAARRAGEAKGLEAGRRAGLLEERLSTLEALLAARNIPVAGRLDAETDRIASMPRDALLKAALESTDLDDFLRRVRSEP